MQELQMMDKRHKGAVCEEAVRRSKGFVLFEVLISVAILSTASLLLAKSLTQSLKAVYTSQDYYTAAIEVENVLWDMDHGDRYVAKSYVDGMNNLRNAELQINEETICNGNLERVIVVLSWNASKNRKDSVTLSTYH